MKGKVRDFKNYLKGLRNSKKFKSLLLSCFIAYLIGLTRHARNTKESLLLSCFIAYLIGFLRKF